MTFELKSSSKILDVINVPNSTATILIYVKERGKVSGESRGMPLARC